jgi:hypothetical protein
MGLFWCKAIRVQRWRRAPLPHSDYAAWASVRTRDLGRNLRRRTAHTGRFSRLHHSWEGQAISECSCQPVLTFLKNLWGVYHTRLGFLSSVEPSEISVRTTYVDRTKQVASGVLAGMDPSTTRREWAVHAQPQLECIHIFSGTA